MPEFHFVLRLMPEILSCRVAVSILGRVSSALQELGWVQVQSPPAFKVEQGFSE